MKQQITIIAAITEDRAIGKDGDMIYHISADLKRFKAITMGHPLIMGRKTFESFPKGPLPGRRNIVVTRREDYHRPGIETYPSLEKAIDTCQGNIPFIIGGGQVYAQAMPIASHLLITEIRAAAGDADTFFPAINSDDWEKTNCTPWEEDPRTGVQFRYVDYARKR